MSTTAPIRAVVYTRISQDREGTGEAVARQREDADELIARRGWTFAGEYRETVSAAGHKSRARFRAMLRALATGQADAVVAWSLDRLTRNPQDRLDLVTACREHGAIIALVKGSDLDPTTASGRLMIGVLGEVAEAEIGIKGERQQAAAAQRVAKGRPGNAGGGRRPFGYLTGGMKIHPIEGEAVKDAAEAFLAGSSLRGIALGWNTRPEDKGGPLLTSTGARWTATTVGQCLSRPRNAGLIGAARHGSTPPRIDGPAAWPALLDRDVWEAVCAKLADPRRRTQRSTSRRLLGSFLYRCGGCGAPLRSGGYGASGQPRYACSAPHPCLRRSAEPIDEMIRAAVAIHLDGIRLPAPEGPDVSAERVLRETLRGKRAEILDDYADGVLTRAERDRLLDRNARRVAELDQVIDSADAVSPLAALGPNAGVAFLDADVDRQRAVIAALGTVIVERIPPSTRPGPDSVRIEWNGVGQLDAA